MSEAEWRAMLDRLNRVRAPRPPWWRPLARWRWRRTYRAGP